MSSHLSVRVDDDLLQRLEDECRKSGQSRSALAKQLLEEGLRMQRHPGIVFRPGATGRRPALAGGPAVWVVARIFREWEGPPGEMTPFIMDSLEITAQQVSVAAGYYAEYRDEIDDWLDRLDEEADRAKAEWMRQRAILRE